MQGFHKVTFQPLGASVYVPRGETVLTAALEAGVEIQTPCGGIGTCGGCRVIFATKAPAPTAEEEKLLTTAELAAGVRLACKAAIESDAVISIPETTMRRDSKFLLHGIMREVALRPAARKIVLDVAASYARRPARRRRPGNGRPRGAGVRAVPGHDALSRHPGGASREAISA